MNPVPPRDYFLCQPQYVTNEFYTTEIDDYIYCELCNEYVYDHCTRHGPLLEVGDAPPPPGPPALPLAARTLPDALYIALSTMSVGALGVFAARPLPARVRFGPYQGCRRPPGSGGAPHSWAIVDSMKRPLFEVDASDQNCSNWLRYVNCAHHQRHQNLIAFQFRRNIYYRTIKPVPQHTELLVYLGSEVAYWLGVQIYGYAYMGTVSTQPPPKLITPSNTTPEDNELNEVTLVDSNPTPNVTTTNSSTAAENVLDKTDQNIMNKDQNVSQHKFLTSIQTQEYKVEKNKKKKISKERRTNLTDENPLKCNQCTYSTNIRSNLQVHIRTHTGERPYKCSQCEYSTTQSGALKTHIRKHTGAKPYKCNQCAYSAAESGTLQKHIRTHTGERPYKCSQCEYSTTHSGALKTHIRKHTGERPYKCSQCEYSAAQRINLQTHIRTHTGERPYKCSQCEYSTTHSGALKTHIRKHTGAKPYKYAQCAYSTGDKSNFHSHNKHKHTG